MRTKTGSTKSFPRYKRLRQGGISSPLLFIIVIDENSMNDLQTTEIWHKILKVFGMKINVRNTEIMRVIKEQEDINTSIT